MKSINFWYTADTHFGIDSNNIITREMRPFSNTTEMTNEIVKIWNKQISNDDIIYVIGDFCNYNAQEKDWTGGLAVSGLINAHIILITGNSEERIITEQFGGDFDKFRDYLVNNSTLNFDDVKRNDYVQVGAGIGAERFFLTHKPVDHDKRYPTLFGHVHRAGGLWRPYGLNVGIDLNHFRLYSDHDILELMEQKTKWWDDDPDNNCF